MFLLYVRLPNRDKNSASPQKNFRQSNPKVHLSDQRDFAVKAHRDAVERLRQVESQHALERRLLQ